MGPPLTKAEARKLIRSHLKRLDANLEAATSQFQVRMCYVNAHDELEVLARDIVDNLKETE